MEAVLGFIVTVGSLFLLFFVFQWIMAKFFGVHYYGRFQARKAFQDQQEIAKIFDDFSKKNPELFKMALERCSKKGFAKTHYNILSEAKKIEDEKYRKESISKKINLNHNFLGDKFILDNSKSMIEELERLNSLRLNGGLSDNEFQSLKKQILNNKVNSESPKVEPKVAISSPKMAKNYFSELDKKEVIKAINLLYFENKGKLHILENLELYDVHKMILENQNAISLVKNYKNLFDLYANDLITKDEFNLKKEEILIKSIKTKNYGTIK